MRRQRYALVGAVALSLGAASALPSCGSPQTTGTKTNWLQACEQDSECGAPATCLCGLCSASCASDAECEVGACGSPLACIARCGGEDHGRFCVPEATGGAGGSEASCTELPIPAADTLGPALASTCDVAGGLLCESFDAPLPPEYAVWHVDDITTSIQDCRVQAGSGAVRFQSSAFGRTQIQMRLPTPVASGPLHARFYAYLPSGIPISTYLIMLELWPEDTEERFTVQAVGDERMEFYLGPNATGHAAPAGSVLRDQWMCIELALDLADPDGAATLSVDGVPVVEQAGVPTLTSTPVSVAVASALPFTDAAGVDLTLDELVIATEPIGCQ